jgi:hypothetical protein
MTWSSSATTLTALAFVLAVTGGAAAQTQAPNRQTGTPSQATPQPEAPAAIPQFDAFREDGGAQATRRQLGQLLRQLPPAVGEVLRRDPSLLHSSDYLAAYPVLVAFLLQHPEVSRNPAYFFGSVTVRDRTPAEAAIDLFEMILGGLAGLTVFAIMVSLLVWLVRTVIDHRRWLRLSRVQAEVHTKLLDRLTSNEDLLTYVQSSAGRRFLESAPITLDGEPRQPSAPLTRIVWSLQAGVVLVALGVGMWAAQARVPAEVGQGLSIVGTIVVALGVGFAVSAVLAYTITAKFGLIAASKPVPHE